MKYHDYDRVLLNRQNEQKDIILRELRKQGLRITKQRSIIIDTILKYECSSCKEIHREVMRMDPSIGIATVYRMINALESVGAIDRKNLYRLSESEMITGCTVILKNKKEIRLSGENIHSIIKAGLCTLYGCSEREIDSIVLYNHTIEDALY